MSPSSNVFLLDEQLYHHHHHHHHHDADPPTALHLSAGPSPLHSEHAYLHPLTSSIDQKSPTLVLPDPNPPSRPIFARRQTLTRPAIRSLSILNESLKQENMSLDDMPDSPPDLSSSKSSTKSSSLHSATGNPGNTDDFHHVSHFEDISLGDVAATSPQRPQKKGPKPRPLLRSTQTAPSPARSPRLNNTPNNKLRDVSNGLRPVAAINSSRPPRSPTSPSSLISPITSPSLGIPCSKTRGSPSPSRRKTRPYAPRSASAVSTPALGTVTSPVLRPRRGSSTQRKRKTAKEIEEEYNDDSGDDLPDDVVISNIPLSPRPVSYGSDDSSPERRSSSTSSTNQAAGRSKSWDTALMGLTTEVRELTTKLDDHAEEYKRLSEPDVSRPPMNGHAITLPPIQRGNMMIDPLPASKEKEKLLSRTRPSWLPPKSKKEEKKHLKQYEQIMSEFVAAEKRKSAEQDALNKAREEQETTGLRTWQMHVLPDWDASMRDPRTRDLWWRGVPAALRGQVWSRAVGNDLHLSAGSYEAALARAKALEQRLATAQTSQIYTPSEAELKANARSKRSITAQKDDIAAAFPEHRLFQDGLPFHNRLRDVLAAYAAYRSDTGHVKGTAGIAALLLVHIPDPGQAFGTLANLLNRPTSLGFCINDPMAKDRTFRHVLRAMKHKTPRLHDHLTVTNAGKIKPDDYLGLLCRSLLTSHLEMAESARILDIFVFEGDGVIVRSLVAFLGRLEGRLYGDATEIKDILGREVLGRGGVGTANAADDIVRWIRWAGQEDAAKP